MLDRFTQSDLNWDQFLKYLNDYQEFAICMAFDRLSLEDTNIEALAAPKPNIRSDESSLEYIKRYKKWVLSGSSNLWQKTLIESMKANLVKLAPLEYAQLFEIGIGFRSIPVSGGFRIKEVVMPASIFDELPLCRDALGLKYYMAHLRHHHESSHGVCDVIESPPIHKMVFEVITEYAGSYGRILVLIVLGVGCTAWYSFIPVDGDPAPTFPHINDYSSFYNEAYTATDMKRISFTEVHTVADNVRKILDSQSPFNMLNMQGQNSLTAVGLAVILGVFITLKLFPDSGIPLELLN